MDTLELFANQEFYESIEHHTPRPRYAELLRELLPEGWTLARRRTWLHAGDGHPLPSQGFKIHVTSTPTHAAAVLATVARECVAMATPFKVAADVALLNALIARYADRGSSGKFMTIYPRSVGDFQRLLARLHEVTRDEPFVGPYVLSDRRYRDSRVLSYRYGGFADVRRLNVDGTRTHLIVDGTGALVPDVREPFYALPPHVADPFAGEAWSADAADPGDDELLHGRYRVEKALRFSNAGGTYKGVDSHTGREVVIKEARPHTSFWTHGADSLDACDTRRHEWAVLQQLRGAAWVPQPVEYFREWEHEFLVEDYVAGVTYWSFWANQRNILTPYVRRPGRVADFLGKFRGIALQLLAAVRDSHQRGVLLGDLSPRNVMVRLEDSAVLVIDLDSAVLVDGAGATAKLMAEYGRQWHTPGFQRAARRDGAALAPVDDWYAVGMLLYGAVIPAQQFFALRGGPDFQFLDMMIASGVPPRMADLVRALLDGRADEARAMLTDDGSWIAPDAGAPHLEVAP